MNNQELRVYVTDHLNLWRIYTIVLDKKKADFFCFTKLLVPKGHRKYSYHPSGATHSKLKKDKKVNKEDRVYWKRHWPDYKDMTIVPIDGHGFEAKDFIKDDPVLQNMKVTEFKSPAIIFDISKNLKAFIFRIWFGKNECVKDFNTIRDRLIENSSDVFVAAQFYNFGKMQTELGEFDLSCVVALIPLENIDS